MHEEGKGYGREPASAIEAIDQLLDQAVSAGASDIHCDPREGDTIVRLRVDGRLRQAGVLPRRLHEETIGRLKILSGARTDLHAVPQDGRWQARIRGETYNVRISFMPTYRGENAVMRLLSAEGPADADLSRLGFAPDHARLITDALERPHGLILVTGPTGSGKTTTLHACLMRKARQALSIITLEDPVEYEIAGVRQVHIHHSFGVTFASGLRAAMRQDPDVIMVGEIRDNETARVAIHTALTGHLVLSTLHTNSALDAIPRLVDMGVDPYLLASTLDLLVAQRLIRKICAHCLTEGCEECLGSGYKGRSVIAEVCLVGRELSALVGSNAPLSKIRKSACHLGFRPMWEDGMEKVEWGVTTRAEVIRVLQDA